MIGTPLSERHYRALYFTRATAPCGDGPVYQHIGVYAYRREALEYFVSLPPSILENANGWNNYAPWESGMRIDVAIVDIVPVGVDTYQDLEHVRRLVAPTAEQGKE